MTKLRVVLSWRVAIGMEETAGPSASLGMTKLRTALPWRAAAEPTHFSIPITTLYGSATFNFVIPTVVEGSAVQRTIPGNVFFDIIDLWRTLTN
jgi:hypothetical protein